MEERCQVEKVGPCVVIRLVSENKENRLNPRFFQGYNRALDQALSYEDATCISEGKFFSLGLDLDLDLLMSASGEEMVQFMVDLQSLFCRLLTFPLLMVPHTDQPPYYECGHIYAAGALLGLCHGYIIMNSSKGFFCFPEIKFPAGLLELAKARVVRGEQRAVLVLGRRYSGEEAGAAGLVDEVCPAAELRGAAVAAAERLTGSGGLDRRTLTGLKRDLFRHVVQVLSETPRFYSKI